MQNYGAPTPGATPFCWPGFTGERTPSTLPALIEQLQNIHLLSLDVADYSLLRSVEMLTEDISAAINRVDPRILDAVAPSSHE